METSYSGTFGMQEFNVYLHAKNKLSQGNTFQRILQFDWLPAFWLITREPEYCQIWDCGEISITILVLILG